MGWKRRIGLRTKGEGGVVAGKSVSHHHPHSAWQRNEQWQVWADTGMMETDWAIGVYAVSGVREIDWATGRIYSGDSGVDSHHIILSYTELHTLSFPTLDLTPSFLNFVDPCHCVDPHGQVVSYDVSLFISSLRLNCCLSRIHFAMS